LQDKGIDPEGGSLRFRQRLSRGRFLLGKASGKQVGAEGHVDGWSFSEEIAPINLTTTVVRILCLPDEI
jgi:hypothetical protein